MNWYASWLKYKAKALGRKIAQVARFPSDDREQEANIVHMDQRPGRLREKYRSRNYITAVGLF